MINRHLLPAAVPGGNFSLTASLDAPLAPLQLAKSDGFPATLLAFLQQAYPRLVAHYDWFVRTQAGGTSRVDHRLLSHSHLTLLLQVYRTLSAGEDELAQAAQPPGCVTTRVQSSHLVWP
jgi:hypothetical protein